MSGRRTWAVARKEFLHILRDPLSLLMALALPLLMLLLFGWALTLDVDRIPTLIHDADGSPRSRELIQRFAGSRYFDVRGYVDSYKTIQDEIDANRVLAGVVIPPDYSADLLAGRAAEVQVLLDGSDSNTAGIVLGYVRNLVAAHSEQVGAAAQERLTGERMKPPAEARLRVLYNSELESKNYIVPGLIAVILMIIAGMMTSLTIAREWESGTMEQVLSTPLRPAEMALGKMAAYSVLGVADTLLSILAGIFIFGVPFRGSVIFLGVSCGVFLVVALFWGIFLSAATRSQLLAYQASMLTSFLPAFLMSGFVFAIENMPPPIQLFTYIVPARYFITMLTGIFLKGVGPEILIGELAMLAVFGLVVFVLAVRSLRQKVA